MHKDEGGFRATALIRVSHEAGLHEAVAKRLIGGMEVVCGAEYSQVLRAGIRAAKAGTGEHRVTDRRKQAGK